MLYRAWAGSFAQCCTETEDMTASYLIDVDQRHCLVRMHLAGFFTAADVEGFTRDQQAAYARLGERVGRHLTLVDVSECKIQTQDVVEAFRRLLTDPARMSRRIAFVTGSSPARMQIRRLIARDSAKFFEATSAAEHWLLEGDGAAAA